MTATHNFIARQNETFYTYVVWSNSQSIAINMTGYKVRMEIRKDKSSSTIIYLLTTENDKITLDPLNGKFYLKIPVADMLTIPYGTYVYDLSVSDADNFTTVLMEGEFSINQGVTLSPPGT